MKAYDGDDRGQELRWGHKRDALKNLKNYVPNGLYPFSWAVSWVFLRTELKSVPIGPLSYLTNCAVSKRFIPQEPIASRPARTTFPSVERHK